MGLAWHQKVLWAYKESKVLVRGACLEQHCHFWGTVYGLNSNLEIKMYTS